MKVRISGDTGYMDMELPVEDAKLAWRMERIGGGTKKLRCMLEEAYGERSPLQKLAGQSVNMDELNFLARRLESLTEYEQWVFEVYAHEQGMENMKDLINLTYSMTGLSLITDFSDAQQVGRRLYMDENAAITKGEEKRINFSEYGEKILAESDCKILPCGVFVTHGFEMQQIYNGRTFPDGFMSFYVIGCVMKAENK